MQTLSCRDTSTDLQQLVAVILNYLWLSNSLNNQKALTQSFTEHITDILATQKYTVADTYLQF